jgi:hypothetical protein
VFYACFRLSNAPSSYDHEKRHRTAARKTADRGGRRRVALTAHEREDMDSGTRAAERCGASFARVRG